VNDSINASLWRKPIVHIAIIAALGFIVYSNTFNVPFVFDDEPNISQNQMIRDISNIPSMFAGTKGPFASRPLLHATAAINYHFGGFDTRGYHLVNLVLHLLNGILLYLLITATGKYKGYPEKETALTALFSSVLFMVHPVQTEAVTYIVSRSMLFATTFYLLGMILFLKAITSENRKGFYIAGLFIASLLGMGSRENFSTFPLMLLIYDLFFISSFRLKEALKHYKAYLPVLISLGYLAHLVLNNTYDRSVEYPTKHIPSLEYALTEFNVHWTYIRLLIFPLNQNIDYDYPISRTLFELPMLVSFIGYLGLLAGGIILARRRPSISFSIIWFLVALLPISFGVAFIKDLKLDDVIFEHRLYLPAAGLMVILGMAASVLLGKLESMHMRTVGVAALVLLALSLSVAAHARNSVWQSKTGLWEDSVSKSPKKVRTYFNLGVAYGLEGLKQKAIEQYKTAIALDPSSPMPHVNLGNAYRSMDMNDKAVHHYKLALTYDPDNPEASKGLGVIYAAKGMADQAMHQYKLTLSKNPNDAIAHVNLGIAYQKKGQAEKAKEHFEQALRLNPDIVMSFVNHGAMYLSMDKTDLAIEQFEKALCIDPDSSNAHIQLGKAYRAKGMGDKAMEHFNRAHRSLGVGPLHGK
jgi:tetratricopeptide (TPR) repeat protein